MFRAIVRSTECIMRLQITQKVYLLACGEWACRFFPVFPNRPTRCRNNKCCPIFFRLYPRILQTSRPSLPTFLSLLSFRSLSIPLIYSNPFPDSFVLRRHFHRQISPSGIRPSRISVYMHKMSTSD